MANGVKTYEIKINGVKESINAVDSLNQQLNDLEQRMNALNSKGVNVSTPKGGGSYKGELDAQEKLEKQILATEEKLAQVRDENYKTLLHMKEELKEYTQVAKSQVASEANQQGLFDQNTMFGLKAQLKSIKQEMQTVEIGSDRFKELTSQANELNNKLKEIEQSYGQFGRNVGNYADGVAQGMTKVKINVNGVDREFKSASGAVRTLRNELRSMAIEGQRGTEKYKEMQKTVAQLSSTIKDATVSSSAMNNLLHTMQSLVSIGQVGQGLGALFGFDDSEIQRSIQKLVGLQNVMMGIERINQQINERVGIGKWLASISTGVDKAVASMLKFNTALLGTSKAAKIAATGIKAFGTALKVAISGGILIAIDAAIKGFSKLMDYLKNGSKEMQAMRQATEAGTEAYVKAKIEIDNLTTKLNTFNGTKEQEKRLVDELNSKYGNSIGQYKTLAEWKQALINKAPAYLKMIQKEAELQVWVNKLVEAQVKLKEIQWKQQNTILGQFAKWLSDKTGWAPTTSGLEEEIKQYSQEAKKVMGEINKLMSDNKIGDFAPQIEKNGKKTVKAAKDVTHDIYKAEIDAMRDGLNKKLMQLEEEKRQTLNKLKENGQATEANIKRVEESFYKKRVEIIKNYLKELDDAVKKTARDIQETTFTINTKELEQDIKNYTTKNWSLGQELPQDNQLFMSYETDGRSLSDSLDERLKNYKDYYEAYIKEIQDNYRKIKAIRDTQIKLERAEEDDKAKAEYDSLLESLRLRLEATEEEAKIFKKKNNILLKDNKETYENLLKNIKKMKDQVAEVETNYSLKTVQNEKDMQQKLQDNWIESNQNIQEQQNRYYESQIDNFRDFLSKMNIEIQKQPVTDKYGFGIVNVKKTKKNYDEIIEAARLMEIELMSIAGNVHQAYKDGIIDAETYNAIRKQLIDLQNEFNKSTQVVEENQRNLFSTFMSSINQHIQYFAQQLNSLMQSIWDYQDSIYEKQMEELEKHIDKYEELLQKQEEITEQHRNKVESIEDELATSRGDRRQHLIDQLNEEIAAQRRSAAEEKKLEKEKKKAEAQKEKEEQKRREREHKREVQQAFISWHLSIANALAVQPWFLGLAMASVATTLGAIQYALVKNSKYADGGVIQGKSHKDGGVPVLGGRAEVEGNEFITNKVTTQKNTDLLYYINSKKRKLDINDFIEFYSGKGGKKAITQMSPRGKFADGGVMSPVLDDSVKVDNRILNALEHYAERPYYVTVTDIENKMDDVNYVRTLAGVE